MVLIYSHGCKTGLFPATIPERGRRFRTCGRVGMAQDLLKSSVEPPAPMTAGRWKSARMPARYTERQAAGRGAVARYYGDRKE